MVDQYEGHTARPGGGVYILHNPFSDAPGVTNLLEGQTVIAGKRKGQQLKDGSFIALDLDYDAKTMAFVTLSFSELLRAFTARSENYPILKVGLFTNRAMNWGVLVSLVLLLAVVYTPFLGRIFNTVPLEWTQWQYVLPLLFVPALAAELTKWVISRSRMATAIA